MKKIAFKSRSIIASFFAVVILVEFLTPSEYVFGYLYTGTILFGSSRLSQLETLKITAIASTLTLLNLFIPKQVGLESATIANRLIVVFALIVTAYLSNRNRYYQAAIATQQAELQSQQHLASIREDFMSTLTHDLKTPLLGAIETLKLLQIGQFGQVTSAQQKVLKMMERSHRTSLQLVETVLNIYRNDISGLKLHFEIINLAPIAEEAIATLSDLAATRRVHIDLSYGASNFRRSLWVKGDCLQLQRVFINLLTNAINHSPRSGKVEIILESSSTDQIVKFLDSGQGITEAELPYLFERFYQGNSDRQAKGSGLGLYLSRQIITAHNGTIWAENRRSKGALFAFKLQAVPPPEI